MSAHDRRKARHRKKFLEDARRARITLGSELSAAFDRACEAAEAHTTSILAWAEERRRQGFELTGQVLGMSHLVLFEGSRRCASFQTGLGDDRVVCELPQGHAGRHVALAEDPHLAWIADTRPGSCYGGGRAYATLSRDDLEVLGFLAGGPLDSAVSKISARAQVPKGLGWTTPEMRKGRPR